MIPKSNTLLAFHRRFLLHRRFGRSWRAALYTLAKEKGLSIGESSLSHIVAADWSSRDLRVESLVADAIGMPFEDVWPDRQQVRMLHRRLIAIAEQGPTEGRDIRIRTAQPAERA